MGKKEREIVMWYILNNCSEAQEYLNLHKTELRQENELNLQSRQREQFPLWFKNHIQRLYFREPPEVTTPMYALACGPHIGVKKYAGCIVNGVRFHTKDRNAHTRTQTCGVMVEGYHVNKLIDFYGVIDEILVVEYVKDKKVVLFKCEWFKLDGRKKGIQTDGHVTSINVGSLWYENDSFILADQAKQVFYLKDTKLGKDWKVVRKCRHRHIFDVPIAPSEVVDSEEVQDNVDIAFQEEVSNVDASLVIEEQHLIGLSRSNLDAEIVDATQVRIVESDHAVEDDEIFVDDCEEVDDTLEDYLSDVEVAQCVEVESDEDADVEV